MNDTLRQPEAHRLSRSMPPELDPSQGARREPVLRLVTSTIIGIVLLALFNAQGIEKWAGRLPGTAAGNAALIAAQHWHDWMNRLGTAGLFEAIRKRFQSFRGS